MTTDTRERYGHARRRVVLLALALLLLAASALSSHPARAAANEIQLGTADPRYVFDPDSQRIEYFDRSLDAGVQIVRINGFWKDLAPTPPVDPRDPSDPAYKFGRIDRAVKLAAARGLEIFITLQRSPDWAESEPNDETRGVYKPDPDAFGDFAHAIALRYSGAYPDPSPDSGAPPGTTLPRVHLWQAWNEGNLSTFLAPQHEDGKLASPALFTELVNTAYDELKALDPDNVVIAGGTAPVGPTGPNVIQPDAWWRAVFCLNRKLEPRGAAAAACPPPLRFDVFDHHPISRNGNPRRIPPGRVITGNYYELVDILRAAEHERTIYQARSRVRPLWATEIYWETDPPDTVAGLDPRDAANYLQDSLYLLWKQGVSTAINFFLVDPPLIEPGDPSNAQGGLYYIDGTPKPSLTAFRFPLVSEQPEVSKTPRTGGEASTATAALKNASARAISARNSKKKGKGKKPKLKKATIWGIPPIDGRVVIERRRGKSGWKLIARRPATAGNHFLLRKRLQKGDRIRATIGAEQSLVWKHSLRPAKRPKR